MTAQNLDPASPEHSAQLQMLLLTRVVPDAPTLLGDDDANWQSIWRSLKTARKTRFIEHLTAEGFELAGLKTRAEVILVRDEQIGSG